MSYRDQCALDDTIIVLFLTDEKYLFRRSFLLVIFDSRDDWRWRMTLQCSWQFL